MPLRGIQSLRLRRLFLEGFLAMDIAEPLVSFDGDAEARIVYDFMVEKDFDLVGIRQGGLVQGYARRQDLVTGVCLDHLQPFKPNDDLLPDTANLIDVVKSLGINEQCFIVILDQVGAIVTLSDLEKPPMRMFLFGMITMVEMLMTEVIRYRYSDSSWQDFISAQRLEKARQLQEERSRRRQKVDLIDCLQFGDKGQILSYDDDLRKALNQPSRTQALRAIKELETLRNNLAHTQEIIPAAWQRIVIACSRFESNLQTIADQLNLLK